jgi:hypothetical protein
MTAGATTGLPEQQEESDVVRVAGGVSSANRLLRLPDWLAAGSTGFVRCCGFSGCWARHCRRIPSGRRRYRAPQPSGIGAGKRPSSRDSWRRFVGSAGR